MFKENQHDIRINAKANFLIELRVVRKFGEIFAHCSM